MAELKP